MLMIWRLQNTIDTYGVSLTRFQTNLLNGLIVNHYYLRVHLIKL